MRIYIAQLYLPDILSFLILRVIFVTSKVTDWIASKQATAKSKKVFRQN